MTQSSGTLIGHPSTSSRLLSFEQNNWFIHSLFKRRFLGHYPNEEDDIMRFPYIAKPSPCNQEQTNSNAEEGKGSDKP